MNTAAIMFVATAISFSSVQFKYGINITPPKDHHFNINAPMSADVTSSKTSKKISFKVEKKSDRNIFFSVISPDISSTDQAKVSAYLCDDKNTYCVRKDLTMVLGSGVLSDIVDTSVRAKKVDAEVLKRDPKAYRNIDEHGFWNNNPEGAIDEAIKTKKPLLIDFYGIWCPPCNLLNEVVFPKSAFKKSAKDFVLLKMDADLESSWEMKSHFNIRGYPTLVFANADLKEISRVVGYMNLDSLLVKMAEAEAGKNISLVERVANAKIKGTEAYIMELKKSIAEAFEQEDYTQVKTFVEAGLKEIPKDLDFKIFELKLSCREKSNSCALDSPVIEEANQTIRKVGTQALADLVELEMNSLSENKSEKLKTQALDGIEELRARVNPKTLQINGFEATAADLDSMVMDVADSSGDEALKKKAMEAGIESNRKLIKLLNNAESRGLNIELAYLLRKTGKLAEAKAIYSKFVKKYPREFTYYLHFAKFYQEQKDFTNARAMIDQAVNYAYGDNKIRCIDTQAKIMNDQGKRAEAIQAISQFLSDFKVPDASLKIRTRKSLDNLKKYKEELEKEPGKKQS